MGSLIMHLCVANELKKKYKFSDRFIVGELMPDLLKMAGKEKNKTHYLQEVIEDSGVKTLPNVLKYEEENVENIKDEKVLGYMSHLVQDKVWYDKYIGKYAKTDANDIDKIEYLQYNITKKAKDFSKDMYNDYINTNKYLAEKYDLDITGIKNTLKGLSKDKIIKDKIDKAFKFNDIDFKKQNVFITEDDLENYINEAVKKSSIEIDKILDE